MAGDNGFYQQKNQRKQLRGWGFTFLGETSKTLQEEENLAAISHQSIASESVSQASFPLTMANVGDRVVIVEIKGTGDTSHFLALGLTPGTELTIVSRISGGSTIVTFQGNRIGLGAKMAHEILVTDANYSVSRSSQAKSMDRERETNTYLSNLPIGCRGRVVGYEQVTGGYKGRLLAMGLTPGTEFTVVHHAPLDGIIEIEVRGLLLYLRKHEADVLCIEEVC
jgi:ferrous iron transport protein A